MYVMLCAQFHADNLCEIAPIKYCIQNVMFTWSDEETSKTRVFVCLCQLC